MRGQRIGVGGRAITHHSDAIRSRGIGGSELVAPKNWYQDHAMMHFSISVASTSWGAVRLAGKVNSNEHEKEQSIHPLVAATEDSHWHGIQGS
jgi:hypothetical protein